MVPPSVTLTYFTEPSTAFSIIQIFPSKMIGNSYTYWATFITPQNKI